MRRSQGVRMAELERDLLSEINGAQARRGLRALRVAPGLQWAAVVHSHEVARLGEPTVIVTVDFGYRRR